MESNAQDKRNIAYAVKDNYLKFSIKDVDTEKRIVCGIANSFNYVDSYNDVLIPGSAKKTIAERGPESNATAKIKHALFHDLTKLPGKILVLKEAKINGIDCIYFETKLSDTEAGEDTLINYLDGIYDNHSIGFKYLQLKMIDKDSTDWHKILDTLINPQVAIDNGYIYLVSEIKLYEISTVAFGANDLTPFLGFKTGNPADILLERMEKYEKALHSGRQSDDFLQTLEVQFLQIKQLYNDLQTYESPEKQKQAIAQQSAKANTTITTSFTDVLKAANQLNIKF